MAHFCPLVHGEQFAPPQSLSVSLPFCVISVHVGTWQTLPVHTPLTQSDPNAHFLPLSQDGHLGPPQSLSVSYPFCTKSMQLTQVPAPSQNMPTLPHVEP